MAPTALLCVDDAAKAKAIEGRLCGRGWRVLGGAFGCDADLVLLDAHATYLLKALKTNARTARLSVVAIGPLELRARCLELGALAFLTWPVEAEPFDALTRFIEHGRSGAAQDHPNKSLARPAPAARVFQGMPK